MTRLRRAAIPTVAGILAAATLIFVALRLEDASSELRELGWGDLALLLPALACMTIAVVLVGAIWVAILGCLRGGPSWDLGLLRFFLYTWPARYVPGTVPYHATRVLLAERAGSGRGAVAASIGYELVLSLGSAAVVGVIGMIVSLGVSRATSSAYLLAALPLIALPLLLNRRVLVPSADWLFRLAGRPPVLSENLLSNRSLGSVFGAYSAVHLLNGVGFYFVLLAVAPGAANLPLAIGVFALAVSAGVLVVLVPGGLGVREGVVVALLSGVATPGEAVLAAGIARAVTVVADLVPVAFFASTGAVVSTWRRLRRRSPAQPAGALTNAPAPTGHSAER